MFYAVALTVLPAVRFLGTEIDPSPAHYFLLSGRDDFRGALANMGVRDS